MYGSWQAPVIAEVDVSAIADRAMSPPVEDRRKQDERAPPRRTRAAKGTAKRFTRDRLAVITIGQPKSAISREVNRVDYKWSYDSTKDVEEAKAWWQALLDIPQVEGINILQYVRDLPTVCGLKVEPTGPRFRFGRTYAFLHDNTTIAQMVLIDDPRSVGAWSIGWEINKHFREEYGVVSALNDDIDVPGNHAWMVLWPLTNDPAIFDPVESHLPTSAIGRAALAFGWSATR